MNTGTKKFSGSGPQRDYSVCTHPLHLFLPGYIELCWQDRTWSQTIFLGCLMLSKWWKEKFLYACLSGNFVASKVAAANIVKLRSSSLSCSLTDSVKLKSQILMTKTRFRIDNAKSQNGFREWMDLNSNGLIFKDLNFYFKKLDWKKKYFDFEYWIDFEKSFGWVLILLRGK